jgi:hypothetical protein
MTHIPNITNPSAPILAAIAAHSRVFAATKRGTKPDWAAINDAAEGLLEVHCAGAEGGDRAVPSRQ